MDTVNETWVCPNCGTRRSFNIKLIDGPAVKCCACRFVYIFTSFEEACKNGWKLGHKDTTFQKLEEENRDLRKTGQTLCNRVHDVLDGIVDESALEEAVSCWEKVYQSVARRNKQNDEALSHEYAKKQEQTEKLIEAGDRMANLINEVFDMITFDSKLKDAVKEWEKVREG